MAEFGSIKEILELAVEREVEANQLYADLAKRAANPIMRRVCEELGEEELEHKAKLELEIIKMGRTTTAGQRQAYFGMDDYDQDPGANLDLDFKDVLALAIEKEKRSVRFYVELAVAVDDKDSREVLLSLAEEEALHRARLEIEFDQLAPKGR